MVDRGTYPKPCTAGGYAQYSEVLVHFIRDVRRVSPRQNCRSS
ncbi:MAG: hypothetical protein CM1200mP29_04350 [Verrucomicrobiota bacterium]|nr:MAG: hypothetical protein CM1200mP29_04350 [Verrucomicrobiota bacterium]